MAESVWTIKRLLDWTKEYFTRAGLESPRLDAEVLLADVLDTKRLNLFLRYQEEVPAPALAKYREFIQRRAKWEPLAYILGRQAFGAHEFTVTPDVLIPRPETEELVETVLKALRASGMAPEKERKKPVVLPWSTRPEYLEQQKQEDEQLRAMREELSRLQREAADKAVDGGDAAQAEGTAGGEQPAGEPFGKDLRVAEAPAGFDGDPAQEATSLAAGAQTQPLRILDIGTGSGCILLSLLAALPQATGVAADISLAALKVARTNAQALGLANRVRFYHSDLGQSLPQGVRYDVVVSNPPYIPAGDIAALAQDVQREPRLALDGGTDGLDIYRRLVAQAPQLLKPGGLLALEIGIHEGDAVRGLCRQAGLGCVAVLPDFAGVERVVLAAEEGAKYADFILGLEKPEGV